MVDNLGGRVPDLELDPEPHSCQRGEKRKKEPTKRRGRAGCSGDNRQHARPGGGQDVCPTWLWILHYMSWLVVYEDERKDISGKANWGSYKIDREPISPGTWSTTWRMKGWARGRAEGGNQRGAWNLPDWRSDNNLKDGGMSWRRWGVPVPPAVHSIINPRRRRKQFLKVGIWAPRRMSAWM